MTEEEWLACEAPDALLDYLQPIEGDEACIRRIRLFTCACCRLLWTELPTEAAKLLALAERHADGKLKKGKEKLPSKTTQLSGIDARLRAAQSAAFRYDRVDLFRGAIRSARDIVVWEADEAHFGHLRDLARDQLPYEVFQEVRGPAEAAARAAQMRLLRDIFGNPFRPITFSPEWRTMDVMLLARGIYAEKAFDRMPILADALQDAGCDSDALLSHLRDPHAAHVRGCWALDLVLGKE
jgi:hypothetical protein